MRMIPISISLVVLSVFIVASSFMGCTPPTPVAVTSPATVAPTAAVASATPATPAPMADTSKEAHLYGYLLGAALPGEQAVTDALNSRLKADINATTDISYLSWSEYTTKYPLILAAGQDVDWVYTAAWCMMADESAKGAFMEMTPDLYAQYMPKHWARIKDTTALKECAVNGKDYMIPTSTPDKKISVVIYRKDLAAKYGIGDIRKFSDIEPFLAAVKQHEPAMIPINGDNNFDISTSFDDLYTEKIGCYIDVDVGVGIGSATGLYVKNFSSDGKLYEFANDPVLEPQLADCARTVKKWYDAGYINQDIYATMVRSKENFAAGKSAVAFGNSIDVQGDITNAVQAGFDVGIIPILDPNGKSPANSYTNNGAAICAKSRNWQRALMALDLMMEDESYVDLAYYGIEGTNYKLTADGKIDYTGIDAALYPLDQAGFWWVDKDYFKPLTSWTNGYAALNNAIPGYLQTDNFAAFTINTQSIKAQIANTKNVITQYYVPITAGAVPDVDAAFKTLADQLHAAGIDDIRAAVEQQITAYLASMK